MKLGGTDDFIKRLPEIYEAVIVNRVLNYLGVRIQRIPLARPLLRNLQLLLFDETRSVLDSDSGQIVQKASEDIHGERTIIVMAHRLSTIDKADWIVALEDRRIIKEGTKKDLLNRERYFTSIWKRHYSDR